MKILNYTKNTILAKEARLADTFVSRMIGLLDRPNISKGEALVITQCQSIHMFFMRFAIDVVFANKDNQIVGLVENIQPFRLSPIFFKASYAIELAPGVIVDSKTAIGDRISLEPT